MIALKVIGFVLDVAVLVLLVWVVILNLRRGDDFMASLMIVLVMTELVLFAGKYGKGRL